MHTERFARKSFLVDAVQVTKENIHEVSAWCQGVVRAINGQVDNQFIKVRVLRPISERQTMAYVGDWILHAGTGYKVYTNAAFFKTFELICDDEYSPPIGGLVTFGDPIAAVEAKIYFDELSSEPATPHEVLTTTEIRETRVGMVRPDVPAEEWNPYTRRPSHLIGEDVGAAFERGEISQADALQLSRTDLPRIGERPIEGRYVGLDKPKIIPVIHPTRSEVIATPANVFERSHLRQEALERNQELAPGDGIS